MTPHSLLPKDLVPDHPILTPAIYDCAQRAVLCWLASVDATGQPSVAPKEIFTLAAPDLCFIANIASPHSVRNIEQQPLVCLSFIDIWVQKGYKLFGRAHNIKPSHSDFARLVASLAAIAGSRFPIHSVIQIQVHATESIVAPSYRLYPDSTTEAAQIKSANETYQARRRST